MDPNYWHAYAALAKIYLIAYYNRLWLPRLGLNQTDAISRTYKYLKMAMKGPTSLAHTVAARLHIGVGNFQESIDEAMKAVSINPNDSDAHLIMGLALIINGRHKESIDSFKRALRLDPLYQDLFGYGLGMAYFFMFEFEKAANLLERSYESNPEDDLPLWFLSAAYAHLGNQREAEAVLAKLRELYPLYSDLYTLQNYFFIKFKEPKDYKLLADGLRKAGMK